MDILVRRIEDSELFAMKKSELVKPLWAPYYKFVADLVVTKEKVKTKSGRVVKVVQSQGETLWMWSDMSVSAPK